MLRHNAKLGEWHKRQQEKRDKEREDRQQQKQQAKLSNGGTKQSKKHRNQHTAAAAAAGSSSTAPTMPPEYRDQGFTRCRVLILLPYAHFAYSVINCILALLPSTGKVDILNKRRYEAEFSGEGLVGPDSNKPADYRYLMTGELNDAFRIGISLGSRGVRLYAPFHASDIIVASPLGLKLLLDGGEGHDWLSSLEVLVMDQCDVFGMQNWQHVESCLQAINQLPTGQILTAHTEEEKSGGASSWRRRGQRWPSEAGGDGHHARQELLPGQPRRSTTGRPSSWPTTCPLTSTTSPLRTAAQPRRTRSFSVLTYTRRA